MQKRGPWTIRRSHAIYSDPWIQVQMDEVTRPDGVPGTYSTVRLKSGVCVIAIDDAGRVHLTKEFHYAVNRVTIEGVSGGIEEDESSQQAAKRELAEELGFTATRWSHLGKIDPFTSAIESTVDLYLAQELADCGKSPEGTELIEHVIAPFEEAIAMIKQGEITHAPTCTALLLIALQTHVA